MHIAFCGFDCSTCPVYIATETNNTELKTQLAQTYATISEEDTCTGCLGSDVNRELCASCAIRACGLEHGVAHCGHCPEYPCVFFDSCIPQDAESRKNLIVE